MTENGPKKGGVLRWLLLIALLGILGSGAFLWSERRSGELSGFPIAPGKELVLLSGAPRDGSVLYGFTIFDGRVYELDRAGASDMWVEASREVRSGSEVALETRADGKVQALFLRSGAVEFFKGRAAYQRLSAPSTKGLSARLGLPNKEALAARGFKALSLKAVRGRLSDDGERLAQVFELQGRVSETTGKRLSFWVVVRSVEGERLCDVLVEAEDAPPVAFSPEGDRLAVLGQARLSLYQLPGGAELWSRPCEYWVKEPTPRIAGGNAPLDLAFASDGEAIAALDHASLGLFSAEGKALWHKPVSSDSDASFSRRPRTRRLAFLRAGRVLAVFARRVAPGRAPNSGRGYAVLYFDRAGAPLPDGPVVVSPRGLIALRDDATLAVASGDRIGFITAPKPGAE